MGVGRNVVLVVGGIALLVAVSSAVVILCGFSTAGIAAGSIAAGI